MNHVTHANPFGCGLVGDFLQHLEDELNWGTSAQWQIYWEEHPSLRDIERLSRLLWRCRVQDGNTEPDPQLEAFCLSALQRFQGRYDSLREITGSGTMFVPTSGAPDPIMNAASDLVASVTQKEITARVQMLY